MRTRRFHIPRYFTYGGGSRFQAAAAAGRGGGRLSGEEQRRKFPARRNRRLVHRPPGFEKLDKLLAGAVLVPAAVATNNLQQGVGGFIALISFLNSGIVHWSAGLIAGVGSVIGGYYGVALARRVRPVEQSRVAYVAVLAISTMLTPTIGRKRVLASDSATRCSSCPFGCAEKAMR